MHTIRFIIIFLLISPLSASAQFIITEIMYDAEGTDTGNEWIEVQNISDSSHDFSTWFFREGDVDHRLTALGSETVSPGGYAIILSNQENFISNFGSNHQLFKSSFSLNNTGETLALSNPEKEQINQHQYASEDGASGDGNSLQYNGESFVSRIPSPSEDIAQQEQTSTSSEGSTKSGSSKKQEPFEPYYEAYITSVDHLLSGNQVTVRAGVYHHLDKETVHHKKRGVYLLNMGDGTQYISDERIVQEHLYQTPGTYIQSLTFFSSFLSYEHKLEPELTYTQAVTVQAAGISISATEFGGLEIMNNHSYVLDISGWEVTHPLGMFTFPEYSYLAQHTTISIPFDVLGVYVTTDTLDTIEIHNAHQSVVLREQQKIVSEEEISIAEVPAEEEKVVILPEIKEQEGTRSSYPLVIGFVLSSLVIAGVRYYKRKIEKEPIQ